MDIYDSHIHSINSFDGKQSVEEICRTALEKKLSGVTVSDHADLLALIPEKNYGAYAEVYKNDRCCGA